MKRAISLLLCALLLIFSCASAEQKTETMDLSRHIAILHTGALNGDPDAGLTLEKVYVAKNRLTEAGMTVLLIGAGHSVLGGADTIADLGEGMIAMLSATGYDALALDDQEAQLLTVSASLPLLAEGEYTVIEAGALKAGVFAANDAVSAGQAVEALSDCDLILGVTSLGHDEAARLSESVDGIDVLLCGGDALTHGQWSSCGTLIVSAGDALSAIGCVVIDGSGYADAMLLDETYFVEAGTADEACAAALAEAKAARTAALTAPLATLEAALEGEALVAWAAETASVVLPADTAVSLPAGELTAKALLEAFPEGNTAALLIRALRSPAAE